MQNITAYQTLFASISNDGNMYSLPFDPSIQFSDFSKIILNNLGISSEKANIKYEGKIISQEDKRKVSQIIENNLSSSYQNFL